LEEKGFDLCSLSPSKISQVLTLYDFRHLKALQPREFYDKAWTRKGTGERDSPNVLFMVNHYNSRSFWAANLILSSDDSQQRTTIIKHLVDIIEEFANLNNFYAVFCLVGALNLTPVLRLASDWSRLSSATMSKLNSIKENVTDGSKNFRLYRRLYKAGLGRPQIPHLAIVLKDCFQLEEIDTVDKEGKVVFSKFLKMYNELAYVFQCQHTLYHLEDDGELLNILLKSINEATVTEDQLWSKSYRCVPKGNDKK